jgi:uncharacterized protein YxjI
VRQRKKWLEILLSFEMKNSYDVYDDEQRPVFRVQELGAGFASLLKRVFLGPMRPFGAAVNDLATQAQILELTRRFRFVFHELEVRSEGGELLGTVKKHWGWFRRIYTIEDASGRVVAEIIGPFFKPWTFEVHTGGKKVGAIRKRWSGWGKELFTDADNFGVELGEIPDPTLKVLAFAATVLIDVVHFERAKG